MTDPLLTIPTLSLISTKKVPNEPPTIEVPYRLAVIGEAPGEDEENFGRPFIGSSGRFLDSILSQCGILRQGVFVGNVCKYRPPGNDITAFGFDGKKSFGNEKILSGWEELKNELLAFRPNAILALGNTPLYFLTGRLGITSWRGSILQSPYGKVIPAVHPAAILRDYKGWPLFRFDTQRARSEAETPTLTLPQRTLELNLTANEICNRLDNWPSGTLLSFDIEGGLDAFSCCSVAGQANHGFIIAWNKYSSSEQGRVAVALSRVLYSEAIPKVLQNSLYDRFVLAYGYRMLIRNVTEDTMLKQWEVYPELPKGLETICSLWTREPNYKHLMIYTKADLERRIKAGTYNPHEAEENKYKACILDSCVTLEACNAQDSALSPDARRHYRGNMDLLNPLLYMELRGIHYDKFTATNELGQVKAALIECASRLELRAGYSLNGAKGSISSTKLKKCLYSDKAYPEQKKGRGAEAKVSTDVEALLNLAKKFPNDAFLADILLHRKLESIQETLEVSTDPDGRVRCGYNLVGTETGRLTCYTSPTGSGANLQTITKKLRKLYTADSGYWLFQCDLSGADGWTVAAHCLRHGDPTMWDDYHFGLKPAKIVALMFHHGLAATQCSREELKEKCHAVDQDGWLYFGCKRVQHMTNYAGQARTGVKQIMIDAYKITGQPYYMEVNEFETLQRLYFLRYPGLYQWHSWAKHQVFDGHNLTSASGHTRTFFGRRKSWDNKSRSLEADHETWKEFLADEPQENTSYANNFALHRLWHDPSNRQQTLPETLSDGINRPSRFSSGKIQTKQRTLLIEPLHTVHDALIGQFPREHTTWAIGKIREWFDNELEIANVKVKIPFEGAYGPSWGQLGQAYGGGTI